MLYRSLFFFLIIFFLTFGSLASTNLAIEGPLNKISNLSINFIEPNEDFIASYESEIINIDDTVIISLIFRETIESNPKFSYSIYRATLTRLKEISDQDYLANKTALEHLMYNTLKDLESGVSKTASIDIEQSESLTCLCAGEGSCGNGSEAEQCNADIDPLKPLMLAGGLVYSSQRSDSPAYAGTSASYNSDLAATWAAREEFDVVNLARDMSITLDQDNGTENTSWTRVAGNNPYEQLNVHKAYGYGLSGDGVKVGLMDDSLCYNASTASLSHIDLQAKQAAGKIETFGSYTESFWKSYTNSSSYNMSVHGCHVATTIAGDYNDNAVDSTGEIGKENGDYGHWNPYTTSGFFSTTHNMERGMMGVAYNSSIHFSDYAADDTVCNGDNDTDCFGFQGWELAFEDAKSKSVKVHNNSWGYLGDTTPEQILAASGTTNADKIATYANAYSSNYSNVTGTQVQEFVDALDSFQETGIVVWASSNDNNRTMSTVYGGTNKSDISTSMPQLFTELQDAWVSVVNVGTRTDGTKILLSGPCAGNAAWCVSHDGFNITAGSLRSESSKDVGSGWFGSWYHTSTGTSMASPQVTGAIALLWEAFPDNSPSVIQKRLIMTADNSWLTTDTCYLLSENDYDNSCGGIDGTVTWNGVSHSYNNLYGHGNPDLYEALQPIGTKSVSFGNQTYALIGTGLLLANTYGDSLSMVGETGLYRDQLHGGFSFNLSDLVVGRNTRNEVHRKLQNGTYSVWSPVSHDQGLNFSYSHEDDINNNGLFDDSGFYSSFVSGKNTIYAGQKYSVDQVLGLRDGNNAMSVLTAHNSNESFLSFTESASSGNLIGSKIDLDNSLSFNVMAYNGVHGDYDLKEKGFLASLKHKTTSNSDFSIFIGQNNEMEGLLRTSGQGAFGHFAGETYHLGTTFNQQIANNIHLAGLFNYGLVTSSSDNAGFLSDVSDLKTSQFNVGMVVSGLGRGNNLMSLNLSQPLRVESGFTNLNIPGRLDQNGNVTHSIKRLSLEPSGRELNVDFGYEMKLFNGALKLGSQLLFDAVHMESNNSETVYGIFKTSF